MYFCAIEFRALQCINCTPTNLFLFGRFACKIDLSADLCFLFKDYGFESTLAEDFCCHKSAHACAYDDDNSAIAVLGEIVVFSFLANGGVD